MIYVGIKSSINKDLKIEKSIPSISKTEIYNEFYKKTSTEEGFDQFGFDKDGFYYSYILEYFPKRFSVNETDNSNRTLVYRFKDGKDSEF